MSKKTNEATFVRKWHSAASKSVCNFKIVWSERQREGATKDMVTKVFNNKSEVSR